MHEVDLLLGEVGIRIRPIERADGQSSSIYSHSVFLHPLLGTCCYFSHITGGCDLATDILERVIGIIKQSDNSS